MVIHPGLPGRIKKMVTTERKFHDGELVLIRHLRLKLIVLEGIKCLKGWNYRLGFPKKDGTLNKSYSHRHFWETNIEKIKNDNNDKE